MIYYVCGKTIGGGGGGGGGGVYVRAISACFYTEISALFFFFSFLQL